MDPPGDQRCVELLAGNPVVLEAETGTAAAPPGLPHLLVEMRKRVTQRLRRHLEHAVEWRIQLQHEKHGATDGQCTHEEDREDRGIPRGKQPEARECDCEPEHENQKEGH